MRKRLPAVLTCVCMLMSLFSAGLSVSAAAEGDIFEKNFVGSEKSIDKYTLFRYNNTGKDLFRPVSA